MKVAQASRLWAITDDFPIMWAHRRDAGATQCRFQLLVSNCVKVLLEFVLKFVRYLEDHRSAGWFVFLAARPFSFFFGAGSPSAFATGGRKANGKIVLR